MFAFWAEMIDLLNHDFIAALSRRSRPSGFWLEDSVEFYLKRGEIYRFLGDDANSHLYYDSARMVCERRLAQRPNYAEAHADLGQVLAGLGKRKEALIHAERAVELIPVEKDAMVGADLIERQAMTCSLIGENDRAIDLIDYLLKNPSQLQYQTVLVDPMWDPLRDNPRFQALLEKYEKSHGT
jgi:serine/threonine-protein kinase